MASVIIRCGPVGAACQHLLNRCRGILRSPPPGAVLWLSPSYRAREAIRPAFLAAASSPLVPRLFTFQDLADDIVHANDPNARPISQVQRRLLAEELVSELAIRGKLPHFQRVLDTRGFAEMVFALLAELKQNEINPEQFEQAIGQKFASGDSAGDRHRQYALIYREYQKRLQRLDGFDSEGRLWYARDLLLQGKFRPFDQLQAVFVPGFTRFSRAQRDILEALAGRAEELWLTLPDQTGDEREELFGPVRQTLAHLTPLSPAVFPDDPPSPSSPAPLPAGLQHLRQQLFRPLKKIKKVACADGLDLIEAPGALGEARLVARRIKHLLQAGTPPDDILIVAREIAPYADLLQEVFAEYQIPLDVEGTEPLQRNPAISTLLRALRVPEEDYPFAQVTALLRSNYFRPDWPETRACADIAQRTEALLRLLAEPRGRSAYLAAAQRWAENPPPGLEDEQAEESRRQLLHELAKQCRDFLDHFLHCWDQAPDQATLADHTAWLRRFADDLGLSAAAAEQARDRAALDRFWSELEQWTRLSQDLHRGKGQTELDAVGSKGSLKRQRRGKTASPALQAPLNPERQQYSRAHFHRILNSLAAGAGLARSQRGPGRVQALSALLARGLHAPHVFVMGLGERSFPQLASPDNLFDEQERQALKQAGLTISCLEDLLPEEMLLFFQIVTSAGRQLTLSYPAVDEKGQELLPSTFLATLLACFEPNAVSSERRAMLIEGYDRDTPLSLAEYRVQAACALAAGSAWPLPVPLADQLHAAGQLAHVRFQAADFGCFDGVFSDAGVIAEVARLFGPERIFSPTALENYSSCPFKFFLGQVLRLEPLEEPNEEIESTDRGLAFHRALSRLHRHLHAQEIHGPAEEVEKHLIGQLALAVEESATRANPAAEALWQLEGERLQRLALRYCQHWSKFLEPWAGRKLRPRPALFEASFGLPPEEGQPEFGPLVLQWDGLEVRISGRIDRVDVVELPDGQGVGFWIIDYKTGRSGYYTAADLKEFRRLQLTLYALAVEQVLLADQPARPLGLAYWMVAERGAKVVLPGYPRHLAWLDEASPWQNFRDELQRRVVELVVRIRSGQFPLRPDSRECTQTCDFGQICRISQSRAVVEKKSWPLPLVR